MLGPRPEALPAQVRSPRKTVVFGTITDSPGSASARYRKVARYRVVFIGPQSGHVSKLRKGELALQLPNDL
jgi:hypothetical protein